MKRKLQEEIDEFEPTVTAPVQLIRYPTGSDLLDMVVGGEKDTFGYGGGMIINVVGDKSTGKSFLCYELVAASRYRYKDDFVWVYDNCESSSTLDSRQLYNFDIVTAGMPRSATVEELSANIRHFLRSLKPGQKAIYVVDSLDSLSSEELEERVEDRQSAFERGAEFTKGSMQMGSAKFLSQEFFRTLTRELYAKQCLLVVVSQLRENVGAGPYAPKYKRAGGKALDFFANAILWLSNMEIIEKKERAIGIVIKAETKKLKAPRPFRECFLTIYFEYGLDNISSNIDFVYGLRGKRGELNKKAEAALTWEDHDFSREELIKYIEENRLKKALREEAVKKWESIEDAIKITRTGKYDDEE